MFTINMRWLLIEYWNIASPYLPPRATSRDTKIGCNRINSFSKTRVQKDIPGISPQAIPEPRANKLQFKTYTKISAIFMPICTEKQMLFPAL